MLTQATLLDLARDALGQYATDYRLAKELKITTSHIYLLRKGKALMSPALALRAAVIAKIDPAYAIAAIERERALRDPKGSTDVAAQFERIARHFSKVAAIVATVFFSLSLWNPGVARAATSHNLGQSIHYAKLARRLARRLGACLLSSFRVAHCGMAGCYGP